MKLEESVLQKALQAGGYIEKVELDAAIQAAKQSGEDLLDYLLRTEVVTLDLVGQAMAESFGVPYADLNSNTPPREQILEIPEDTARKFNVVLFEKNATSYLFATDNPRQSGLAAALKKHFPNVKSARVAYSLTEDIEEILLSYRKRLQTRFVKIVKSTEHAAPKMIDEIMKDALTLRASDIHFEPQQREVIIRFRIDDVLQEAGRLPRRYYETILNRIKVMAHLRTDDHFSTQDGAMRYELDGEAVDLRISIAPIVDGEKVAVRILSRYVREFNLGNLGLSDKDQQRIQKASKLPFGMVLVTGPTGSGKTTTLYSMVKILNDPSVNITTIEDPVEYRIPGVNHIQVNPQTELTFAKGLRSIVRQDPDIVLVGEIRDEETADIAVNAALTGHLLFSTFHANDAATAIPRLLDMGTEPFLLASTLELLIAQRLVRKICENCRASVQLTAAQLKDMLANHQRWLGKGAHTLYKGKGCTVCGHTGYKGRVAIFEIITITPEMEQLILTNPSTQDVWKLARSQGAMSMFEDGIAKAQEGETTIGEVLRVANPPLDS